MVLLFRAPFLGVQSTAIAGGLSRCLYDSVTMSQQSLVAHVQWWGERLVRGVAGGAACLHSCWLQCY